MSVYPLFVLHEDGTGRFSDFIMKFLPESDESWLTAKVKHCKERLEQAQSEIARLQEWYLEEDSRWVQLIRTYVEEGTVAPCHDTVALRESYSAALDQAKAWQPPAGELPLKTEVIKHLEEAIIAECELGLNRVHEKCIDQLLTAACRQESHCREELAAAMEEARRVTALRQSLEA